MTDKASAILGNVLVSDKSLNVDKKILGEIPTTVGEHRTVVRVTYQDGSYSDITMNIRVEASQGNSTSNTPRESNSPSVPDKTEPSNNSGNNTIEETTNVSNTTLGTIENKAQSKMPLYLILAGLITSVLLFIGFKSRKKDSSKK